MAIKTIIERIDNCVGCPPEMGCNGRNCPNYPHTAARRAKVCDGCDEEVELRWLNGMQLCMECSFEQLPAVD